MRPILLPSASIAALVLSACSGSNTGTLPVAQLSSSGVARVASTPVSVSAFRRLRTPLRANSVPAHLRNSAAKALCTKPADGDHAGCFAVTVPASTIRSVFPDDVYGLTPNDLSSLYKYAAPANQGSLGSGITVAVVVAGAYPQAAADLAVYRSYFGLPACTTANGCLTFLNAPAGSASQTAATTNSSSISAFATTTNGAGWAAEADSDVEIVSAVCPHCKIMVAEAASDSLRDLAAAAGVAVNSGASIVNTSFGSSEQSGDTAFNTLFGNSRVKFVSAAGDWGYGVYFPASHADVVAVGGTSLSVSGSTVAESAWSGTGSGCSSVFSGLSVQSRPLGQLSCLTRTVADVSAVADPNTGVAVYDSALGGWSMFGGTSVATPIITGMYALAGDTSNALPGATKLYMAPSYDFLAVTSGSNGSCSPAYLCTAVSGGYNGPTGLGIPQGLGAF